LLPATAAAAPVTGAVGAGAVPGHANEERPVVTEVRRPPVLRVRHQRGEIALQPRIVEAREGFGIVEVAVHRIGLRRMLVQEIEPQLVGPPVAIGGTAAMLERTLALAGHARLQI
jgi:hypothetical protein